MESQDQSRDQSARILPYPRRFDNSLAISFNEYRYGRHTKKEGKELRIWGIGCIIYPSSQYIAERLSVQDAFKMVNSRLLKQRFPDWDKVSKVTSYHSINANAERLLHFAREEMSIYMPHHEPDWSVCTLAGVVDLGFSLKIEITTD
ncbi:uncharacterized protein TRUGW13939_07548 [Talaromyces rugulosus]|uniref:Uncharacterized protein n=1 Tax=Talaromyces rugulosus TaxID=121627 RepID=A0A7H8R6F0_TALRU|nr:uncharacterized protein TRUGW13939_07548 [Talaromyces rugulosus]QKX60403.1 hypothetical protein TRUGW13939_07548 [Talaromyces rugulosus]